MQQRKRKLIEWQARRAAEKENPVRTKRARRNKAPLGSTKHANVPEEICDVVKADCVGEIVDMPHKVVASFENVRVFKLAADKSWSGVGRGRVTIGRCDDAKTSFRVEMRHASTFVLQAAVEIVPETMLRESDKRSWMMVGVDGDTVAFRFANAEHASKFKGLVEASKATLVRGPTKKATKTAPGFVPEFQMVTKKGKLDSTSSTESSSGSPDSVSSSGSRGRSRNMGSIAVRRSKRVKARQSGKAKSTTNHAQPAKAAESKEAAKFTARITELESELSEVKASKERLLEADRVAMEGLKARMVRAHFQSGVRPPTLPRRAFVFCPMFTPAEENVLLWAPINRWKSVQYYSALLPRPFQQLHFSCQFLCIIQIPTHSAWIYRTGKPLALESAT